MKKKFVKLSEETLSQMNPDARLAYREAKVEHLERKVRNRIKVITGLLLAQIAITVPLSIVQVCEACRAHKQPVPMRRKANMQIVPTPNLKKTLG